VKHVQYRAEEVLNQDNDGSDSDSDEAAVINEASKVVKYKAARSNKSSHEFQNIQLVQALNQSPNVVNSACPPTTNHPNATPSQANSIIWVMKFSPCGRLLASAGKDQVVRVWVLNSFQQHFAELIKNYKSSNCILFSSIMKANSFYKSTVSILKR